MEDEFQTFDISKFTTESNTSNYTPATVSFSHAAEAVKDDIGVEFNETESTNNSMMISPEEETRYGEMATEIDRVASNVVSLRAGVHTIDNPLQEAV